MRKDILIQLDNFGNACDYNKVIGINGENLQGKLSFILDTPIKGVGYIEVLHDEVAELIPAETDDYHTYYIDIKNNLLKYSKFYFQLRINEDSEITYPVFKSVMLTGYVGDAINASEIIPDPYPDWISKADKELEKMIKQEAERQKNEEIRENQETARQENEETRQNNENSRQEYIENLKDKVNKGDFNGATYLPSVDKEGNISWTNDKGLENPSSQNIRGPQGIQGPQGEAFKIKKTYPSIEAMQADFNNMEVGDYVMITSNIEVEDNAKLYSKTETEWVFITDFSGATGIQGEQGPQGEQGIQGERGIGISRLEVRDGSLYVTLTDNTTQNAGLIITDEAKNYIIDQVTNNAKSDFNVYYDDKVANFDNLTANKIKEYNDNASQKIAEYDEHSTELNNKVVSTRNELERVKNDILETGSASDSFINVQDSAWAKLQKLEIDGVTKQTTTTGKNKFDKNNPNLSPENYNLNDNGELVSAGSWYVAQYLEVLPDTTYTLSGSRIPNTWMSRISQYDANKNHIVQQKIPNTKNVFTFTTESAAKYISFNLFKDAMDLSTIQLEQGNTATDYEPYTGGQPSPSPDYPQEIEVQTGEIKLTSCNKNLCDISCFTDNYSLNTQGLPVTTTGRIATIDPIYVGNMNKVALSWASNMIGTMYAICSKFDNSKKLISRTVSITSGTSIDVNDCLYIYLALYQYNPKNNEYLSISKENVKYIQVEISNTPTSYVDHLYSQITAKLPEGEFIGKFSNTNKDYVSLEYKKEEGQYHVIVNKKIKKRILTANDKFRSYSSTIPCFGTQDFTDKASGKSNFMCNSFSYLGDAQFQNLGYAMSFDIGNYSNYMYIQVPSTIAAPNELSKFVAFIGTLPPIEIYYEVATPYKIDLGPIDMPLSYNEVTNIFTDNDLLPKINAKYYRNFITTVQNLQVNEKALKQELADINTRLTALEAAQTNVVESEEEANDIQVQ